MLFRGCGELKQLIYSRLKIVLEMGYVPPLLVDANLLVQLPDYSIMLNIEGESYRPREKRKAGRLGRRKPKAQRENEVALVG